MSDETIQKLAGLGILGCVWILSTILTAYAIDVTKDPYCLWTMVIPMLTHTLCKILYDLC